MGEMGWGTVNTEGVHPPAGGLRLLGAQEPGRHRAGRRVIACV